jgi:RNA polymerase ECF-type sigma factor
MLISNEQIFEKLFREYYSHLCNYAGRYIIDSQIREDIVQVFFISIWEKKNLSVTSETFLPMLIVRLKTVALIITKQKSLKKIS